MILYSYNQLKALYGIKDRQVRLIDEFIKSIGNCIENKTLKAFKRLEIKK